MCKGQYKGAENDKQRTRISGIPGNPLFGIGAMAEYTALASLLL